MNHLHHEPSWHASARKCEFDTSTDTAPHRRNASGLRGHYIQVPPSPPLPPLHATFEVVAAEEAEAEEVEAAVANFEQLPMAMQKMWVHAHDEDKFREHAGPVIAAYKKALEAGALESTAERATALGADARAIQCSGRPPAIDIARLIVCYPPARLPTQTTS